MTKQTRIELIEQAENDYESLNEIVLSLENFLAEYSEKENPSRDIEKKLQQAHSVLDDCVGALYSLIPDPEDS